MVMLAFAFLAFLRWEERGGMMKECVAYYSETRELICLPTYL